MKLVGFLVLISLCIGVVTIADYVYIPTQPISYGTTSQEQPQISSVNPYFAIENSSSDIVFKVDHEGHVGINIPSPINNLHVIGDGNFTTNMTVGGWTMGFNTTSLVFKYGGDVKMALDTDGTLHVEKVVADI